LPIFHPPVYGLKFARGSVLLVLSLAKIRDEFAAGFCSARLLRLLHGSETLKTSTPPEFSALKQNPDKKILRLNNIGVFFSQKI